MATLRREHAIGFGLLAGAAILFYAAHNSSGGSRPPKYATTEDVATTPDLATGATIPLGPVDARGYLCTQHRFPHRVGHEVSMLIEGGHSPASVPKRGELYWIERPPSELIL